MTEAELFAQIASTTGPLATLLIGFFVWIRAELHTIKDLAQQAKDRADANHERLIRLELHPPCTHPGRKGNDLTRGRG